MVEVLSFVGFPTENREVTKKEILLFEMAKNRVLPEQEFCGKKSKSLFGNDNPICFRSDWEHVDEVHCWFTVRNVFDLRFNAYVPFLRSFMVLFMPLKQLLATRR